MRRSAIPNGGSGVESPHVGAVFEDDPRAVEANSGNHIGNDPAPRRGISGQQQAAHDEGGCPGGNKGVGAGAGHPLAPLAFKANGRAHQKRRDQLQAEWKCVDAHAVNFTMRWVLTKRLQEILGWSVLQLSAGLDRWYPRYQMRDRGNTDKAFVVSPVRSGRPCQDVAAWF